ncbi:MAG TPA: 5'-nucleotidase C-terminal domain-containing protein, partial [Bacteroidia bacterium]|nr:5'-nucleotidase C-terminal domain-containing protein [Bacteroidia bacterium]
MGANNSEKKSNENLSVNDSKKRRDFLKLSAAAGIATLLAPAINIAKGTSNINSAPPVSVEPDPGSKTITFLITTDIHAQLFTHDEFFWENEKAVYRKRGGLAVLKTMMNALKAENPNHTIIYDGGDYFHGHAIASLTEGEALIPVFNKLEYDLILPGNWEVVYKKKKMLFDMGHSNAVKICANMFHKSAEQKNCELVYPPYWIKYIAGVKIGVIGYTDHLIPKRQSPAYSEGLTFEHADQSLAKYVKLLREDEACAVVLVATHMGLAQQVGLANNPVSSGVDFIMGADTHERVRVPIEGKYTKVIECGAFGSFLGKLDLKIENGKLAESSYQLLDVDPEKYPADKSMQALIDEISTPYKKELQQVIGTSKTPLVRYFVMETPMDNFITDAIMWKFKPDVALSNGFRFCQPLNVDPKTGVASITKEFLWNMLPVNSEAKSGIATGTQIMEWLEKELQNAFAKDPSKRFGGWFVRFNGMEVNFTIGNEFGKRVNWVKIGKKPLDLTKEYKIIACEREGDPDDTICRMEKVKNPTKLNLLLHDVIEEYL